MSRRTIVSSLLALMAVPLLWAAPASAGAGCHDALSAAAGQTVGMTANCFAPGVIHARAGKAVRFVNDSTQEHTVTGLGRAWWANVRAGETVTFRFDSAGVYPFFCEIHPGMIGAVVIGDGAAPGLQTVVEEPEAPETVEEIVEDAAGPVEDTAEDATGALAAASGATSGPRTAAVGIVAVALGFGAGLVLRGRSRAPVPLRAPVT